MVIVPWYSYGNDIVFYTMVELLVWVQMYMYLDEKSCFQHVERWFNRGYWTRVRLPKFKKNVKNVRKRETNVKKC